MKRKIVRHGPSSLTISLPMKWAKEQGLNSGDEIDITQNGKSLIVGSNTPQFKSINIDLSDVGEHMARRLIGGIYKAGFDNIRVKYKTTNEFKGIQDDIQRVTQGFEILKYSSGEMEVKAISQINLNEFDSVLRRFFYVIKNIGLELISSLKNKNYQELDNIMLQDRTVDRHSNFCRRALNKGIESNLGSSNCIYYIVEECEIIADYFKEVSEHILNKKVKMIPEYIKIIERNVELFDLMIKLFYKFDMDKTKTLGEMEDKLKNSFIELEKINNIDIRLYSLLYSQYRSIFEMKSALFTAFIR